MDPDHPDSLVPGKAAVGEATLLLDRIQAGDASAAERLLTLVYDQLRLTAGAHFQGQAPGHTLQPTALVHEVYLKLVGNPDKQWESRAHFCAVASTAMRHILKDHARAKLSQKRKASGQRVPLTQIETPAGPAEVDLIALDEALTKLAEADEQGARIVELRYFGGLSIDESARVLGVSPRTADRIWRRSRAWIRSRLGEETGPG
ncbi:MAG: sigma-70 family RNA polymerase sigma factor [Phycisphaerales bacterium]